MWPETGERLTRESYAKYRKQGGYVIMFTNTEEVDENAIRDPLTMIAERRDDHPRQGTSADCRHLFAHPRASVSRDPRPHPDRCAS